LSQALIGRFNRRTVHRLAPPELFMATQQDGMGTAETHASK